MTNWPLLSSLVAEICDFMQETSVDELSTVVIKSYSESENAVVTVQRRRTPE